MVRTIFQQLSREEVHPQADRVIAQLREHFPQAAQMLEDALPDILAFATFPVSHWQKLWSNNPLERLNKEIRRRRACPRKGMWWAYSSYTTCMDATLRRLSGTKAGAIPASLGVTLHCGGSERVCQGVLRAGRVRRSRRSGMGLVVAEALVPDGANDLMNRSTSDWISTRLWHHCKSATVPTWSTKRHYGP